MRSWVQIPYRPEFFSGLIYLLLRTSALKLVVIGSIANIHTKNNVGVKNCQNDRTINEQPK